MKITNAILVGLKGKTPKSISLILKRNTQALHDDDSYEEIMYGEDRFGADEADDDEEEVDWI